MHCILRYVTGKPELRLSSTRTCAFADEDLMYDHNIHVCKAGFCFALDHLFRNQMSSVPATTIADVPVCYVFEQEDTDSRRPVLGYHHD